ARATPRRRARLCAHRNTDDALHEMIIVLDRATYVRPHRHCAKSESFHVVEGLLNVVLFDDSGGGLDVIRMGDYASGRQFYYRLTEPVYHTVLIESDLAVIRETTNGPFVRQQTEFAAWAPAEEERDAAELYLRQLVACCKGRKKDATSA